jgi:EmrB/QacA subfamily drug resistance transporter
MTRIRDQREPLAAKWWVLLAMGLGALLTSLNSSAVNTVLPVLRQVFAGDVAAVQWVVTIYLLVVSGLLLTFGRIGDLYGYRTAYLWGATIFVLGSAACALAPTIAWLVFLRALQAVGAALLFSNAPAILTHSFPAAQRGQALGLQATLTYLGLTIGPSLGGWLTAQLGWQMVFLFSVPVGLVAWYLGWRFVPHQQGSGQEEFDVPGALAFVGGLVALLLALNRGYVWGWTSFALLATVTVAIILLAAFVRIEQRRASPMLDLSLFQKRIFSQYTASAVLNYVSLYSVIFLMPFYLIQGRSLNPAQAGLILTAQPVVMAIVAPLSGSLSDRIGSRLPTTLGMLILAIATFLLSRMGGDTALWAVAGGLALTGLGTGLFVSPNNSSLMGAAPRNRQGIAGAVLGTARNIGMVLGIGIAGAIFNTISIRAQGGGSASFFAAIQASFLVAAGAALLAGLLSWAQRE